VARIVQGYVCGRIQCTYVRKCRIVSLKDGEEDNLKLLLAFAIGKAVGNTKWDDALQEESELKVRALLKALEA
jgi:hypothetical protein